jgi:hypothetical protein
MIYKPFEEYLSRVLEVDQNKELKETNPLQGANLFRTANQFGIAPNLAFAGGSRLEYFIWDECPQLSKLTNKRIMELVVDHYTQQGYALIKRDPPEDADFEKDGVNYFASWDLLFSNWLKFSFDRQIYSRQRMK